MSDYQHFDVQHLGDVTVILVAETKLFGHLVVDSLHDEMTAFVAEEKPEKLVVYLGQVQQCSSGAVNCLLSVKKQLAAYGAELKLCALSDFVEDAFARLGLLGTVFDVHESLDEAEAAFAANA